MPKAKLDPKKMLHPGTQGFNDPRLPWGGIRNILGWKKPAKVQLEVHGFFLIDRRRNPAVAIFKNCEVAVQDDIRPILLTEPKPFAYLGEAISHRDHMHLSADDEKLVVPVALCPDEGSGREHPQYLFIDPKEARQR